MCEAVLACPGSSDRAMKCRGQVSLPRGHKPKPSQWPGGQTKKKRVHLQQTTALPTPAAGTPS